MKSSGRIIELTKRLADELRSGRYGAPGERFLTVRQLAGRFGVSLSSACRIFSELSERQLICLDGKNYYITTGYVPKESPYGGILAKSRRRMLGMIENNINTPYFSALAQELSGAAAKEGYRLILATSGGDIRREAEILRDFRELGVCGVFTCPSISPGLTDIYSICPLPVVSLGRDLELENCDTVLVDNFSAGAQAAKHLYEIGCRRFAYVGLKSYIGEDPRVKGFCSRLNSLGYSDTDISILTAGKNGEDIDISTISGELYRLLHELPDRLRMGIFCYHDLLAVETLHLIKHRESVNSRHLMVPKDVAIIGFDDLPISSLVTPSLTTISYRFASIAKKSLEIMLDYIGNPEHITGKYPVASSLTVRESTAAREE